MAKYHIPEKLKIGFQALSAITLQEAEAIAKHLAEMKVGESFGAVATRIKDAVKAENIETILQTIFSVVGLISREKNILDTDAIVKNLVSSFEEDNKNGADQKKLADNLNAILKQKAPLTLTRKAFELIGENDKIYSDSRIISDIRIIFNDNIKEPKQHAVLIHQLRVSFSLNGHSRQSFYALDTKDLQQLKEHIDRALEKDKLIRENYCRDMSFIEVNE